MAEKERIGKGIHKTLTCQGAATFQGAVAFNGTVSPAGALSLPSTLTVTTTITQNGVTTARSIIPLAAVDTAGGIAAVANPFGANAAVTIILDVGTIATAACSVSCGVATNATTSSANLIDTLDVHTAAGTFSNLANPGTLGKAIQRCTSTQFVTVSKASGASAGIVGNLIVEWVKLS